MNKLFFSVIIPTFNRETYLNKTIQSVLNQVYENFELIIVNDGSTDDSEKIIKSFNDKRIVYLKIINSERGAARNKGVQIAKGDYVTFLDSDDVLYSNYLENACIKLNIYDYPVFFHQSYEIKNKEGKTFNYGKMKKDSSFEFLIKGNPLSCLGVFIKRKNALLFPFSEDRNLSGSEDWELWLRLSANYGIITDPVLTACLFIHDGRSVLNVNEHQLLMRKNLALDFAFNDEKVLQVFGKSRKKMEAYCDSYIALHLVLAKQNLKGLKYFFNSVKNFPSTLFERRFLAILKNVILNLLSD